jgi:hypothetical protein
VSVAEKVGNLESLLDGLCKAASSGEERLSVQEIVRAIGERSFGGLLFVAGVLTMTPVSGIPGVATVLGLFVVLVGIQMLFGRRTLWLPAWLLKLKVNAAKLRASVCLMRKPARLADRVVKPRLCFITEGIARRIVALICVMVGAATPPLELVPFSTFFPAVTITAIGLGLTTRDGSVIVIALAFSAGLAWLILWRLLG